MSGAGGGSWEHLLLPTRWRPDCCASVRVTHQTRLDVYLYVMCVPRLLLRRWTAFAAFTTRGHVVRAMLEAICFQTREVLEAMILDTAGMQHSASCPDLDPAVLEAAGGGGGGGLSRSRLGSASNSMSRLAIDSSAVSSSSVPPSMTALAPSLQQQQQQHQSGGGGGGGGGVALKARDTSGDGGRVSISSWGSSQQLLGGSSGYSLNLLRVDGGATNNNLLMQLQVGVVWHASHTCFGGVAGWLVAHAGSWGDSLQCAVVDRPSALLAEICFLALAPCLFCIFPPARSRTSCRSLCSGRTSRRPQPWVQHWQQATRSGFGTWVS